MHCLRWIFITLLVFVSLPAFAGWVGLTGSGGADLTDVDFTRESTGTAVGLGGVILRTSDGGFSWHAQTGFAGGLNYFAVSFANDTAGVVTGEDGMILRTLNGGAVWDSVQAGLITIYLGVQMRSATEGMAVGQNTLFAPLGARTTNSWQTHTDFTWYPVNDKGAMVEAAAQDVALLNDTIVVTVASTWNNQGAITRSVNSGRLGNRRLEYRLPGGGGLPDRRDWLCRRRKQHMLKAPMAA